MAVDLGLCWECCDSDGPLPKSKMLEILLLLNGDKLKFSVVVAVPMEVTRSTVR